MILLLRSAFPNKRMDIIAVHPKMAFALHISFNLEKHTIAQEIWGNLFSVIASSWTKFSQNANIHKETFNKSGQFLIHPKNAHFEDLTEVIRFFVQSGIFRLKLENWFRTCFQNIMILCTFHFNCLLFKMRFHHSISLNWKYICPNWQSIFPNCQIFCQLISGCAMCGNS